MRAAPTGEGESGRRRAFLRNGALVALLLVGCALAPIASAQEADANRPDAQSTAAARALFEEGVAYSDANRWEEAADRFRRSLALRPSPVVAYNLASALVHLGELVEASELLQGVARDEAAPEPARAAAASLLEEVQPRLGRLTIHLDGYPMEIEVRVDGRVIREEAVGVPVPADPGTAEVRVMRGREAVAEGTVEVPEGGEAELRLEVPPPPVVGPEADQGYRPGAVLRGERVDPAFQPGSVLRTAEVPEPQTETEREAEPETPTEADVPSPEETARATPPAEPQPEPEPAQEESLLSNGWFWAGVVAGVVVAAGAAVAIVLFVVGEEEPQGIEGSLGVFEF